jgi:hypothetical protein
VRERLKETKMNAYSEFHGFGSTNKTLCGDEVKTVKLYGDVVTHVEDDITCLPCINALNAHQIGAALLPQPKFPGLTWIR